VATLCGSWLGGSIRIAHYDVIDESIRDREKQRPTWQHEILWAFQSWKSHRSTTTFTKPEITSFMTS